MVERVDERILEVVDVDCEPVQYPCNLQEGSNPPAEIEEIKEKPQICGHDIDVKRLKPSGDKLAIIN